tara:strand:- start:382 stop:540 length:159 start_codon:yes stop_codon:yes gene_type:complete
MIKQPMQWDDVLRRQAMRSRDKLKQERQFMYYMVAVALVLGLFLGISIGISI